MSSNSNPPARIDWFKGKWADYSNFADAVVTLDGVEYRSTEHAYQAAKVLDPEKRKVLSLAFNPTLTAAKAKKIGRNLKLRDGWDEIKKDIMVVVLTVAVVFEGVSRLFVAFDALDTLTNRALATRKRQTLALTARPKLIERWCESRKTLPVTLSRKDVV